MINHNYQYPDWFRSLKYSIDWVNFVVDRPSFSEFLYSVNTACGLDPNGWERSQRGGLHWYSESYTYSLAGRHAIVVSYSPLDGDLDVVPTTSLECQQHGILVSISGDGCRFLDHVCDFGLQKFLRASVEGFPYHCTRIDACVDVFDRDNPLVPLYTDFALQAYNWNKENRPIAIRGGFHRKPGYVRTINNFDPVVGDYTTNVYIGDRNTFGCVNIYNKRLEVESGRLRDQSDRLFDELGVTEYWYRIEYRAKCDRLTSVAFDEACVGSAQSVFFKLADSMFDFVELKYDLSDISRCDLIDVWALFLQWCEESLPNAHFV